MSSSIKNDPESKKFLFDSNDFGERKIPEKDKPAYSENQLILAREQSHALGKKDGLLEAEKIREEKMHQCLQRIEISAVKLIADEERRETEKMVEAAKLALHIARKLLPEFAQKFSLPEIERTILGVLDARRDEARIAVTVPSAHLDSLKARIDAMALEKGYAGKIIIIGDDAMALTDCRIEWADGGAERLYNRLFSQVEAEFTKAISGMQSAMDEGKKNT